VPECPLEIAMGLTHDFRDNPLKFLGDYIVVVEDQSEGDPPKKQPVDFFISPVNSKNTGNNYVFLVKCSSFRKSDEKIPAYWLPWKKKKANVLTLGDQAQFMFTSELTNCRFSVLTGNMANPVVSHVEGTGGSEGRDKLESETKVFPTREADKEKKLMRRLSVHFREADVSGKKHEYVGQDGAKKSSAFVFGYRETKTSPWKFYAQIVTGVMAGNNLDTLKSATEKVVPFDNAYLIA
jgi:hypothetical protein